MGIIEDMFKPPKLKLVHQGLILITVPLLFGFVCILILESLTQTYRQIRNQAVYSVKVSERMYSLNSAALQLSEALSSDHPPLSSTFPEELKNLKEVVEGNGHSPGSAALLAAVERDWTRISSALKLESPSRATSEPLPTAEQLKAVHTDLRILLADLNKLSHEENTYNAEVSKNAKQLDRFMQQILACVLVANVLVCPLLVLYFSQTLMKRLQTLVENSDRFARGRELLPPISGSDEIAEVDAVFRTMADAVTQAEQRQREFVATINHDIRTPLNAVQATLSMIAEGVYGELTSDGVQRAKSAERIADELVAMINQLLDMEQIRSGKLDLAIVRVDLRILLQRSVATLEEFCRAKSLTVVTSDEAVSAKNNDESTPILVLADEGKILQVFLNLLGNAIKFANESSTLYIRLITSDPTRIRVEIQNSGVEIPPGMESSIFERFEQIRNERPETLSGHGLGLAICKQIIEGHNESIGVSSQSGQGCTFWFTLRKFVEQDSRIAINELVSS